MAWTAPYVWTTGHLVTAAELNAQLKDNMRYLKGLDGAATFESDLTVDNLITTGNVDGIDVSAHDVANTGVHGIGASTFATAATLATHAASTTTHGAVSTATASRIVVRDAQGQAAFAAPAGAGDALIKGTRHLIAEMPTLTTDKIWKGVGGVPAEVDAPGGATKEFFVPVWMGKGTGGIINIGDFQCIRILAGENVWFGFKAPHNFSSLTHCKVVGIAAGGGTMDWTAITDFAAVGEAYTTHSDSDTADGLAIPVNEIVAADISAALTGLLADDYVGVKFTADAYADGLLYAIGLVFKYT